MSDNSESGRSGGAGKGGAGRGGSGRGGPGKGGAGKGGFNKGARPGGPPREASADRPRAGKPPFGAGKPGGDRTAKPYRARPAGEGAAGGERPPFNKRDSDSPQGERKPFRPRTERSDADARPFRKSEGGGERSSFRKRDSESVAPQGERKPFRPRVERPDGERKPFVKREPSGERGTFRKREEGDRPAPGEHASRNEGGRTFTPRSHGMNSHGGAAKTADASGERPRSYGHLSHDEGGSGERKPRSIADRPPRRERSPAIGVEEALSDGTMRIAKRLARAGIASRRDAEGMIADGRVSLNGKLLDTPAVDVTMSDRIEVDGKPLPAIERTRLWMFHKPAGLVTTNRDPEGRPTVFDRLPEDMPRVLSIGRLDINTEGLLLLTNDGGLARVLELPATGWLRRYRVRARGEITQERLDELRQGVAVEGVFYGAIEAVLDRSQGSNVWLTLGLREGKNREVKRVLGHLGLEVNRLIRISFGPFQLSELAEGAVQEIKGRMLRDQLGDRLIEEAGADFDAPIVTPFSNKPVAAERRPEPSAETPARPVRAKSEWISASDSTPNRKKFGAAKREDALGRMDTKAPRGFKDRGDERGERAGRTFEKRSDKPFASRGDKPSFEKRGDKPAGGDKPDRRPSAPQTRRSANVWMAPGARATGEKKKAEREDRAQRFPRSDTPRPSGFKPRAGASDRPAGDRLRNDRPKSDRPRSDRPAGERPAGERPGGDRPRGGGAGRGGKS